MGLKPPPPPDVDDSFPDGIECPILTQIGYPTPSSLFITFAPQPPVLETAFVAPQDEAIPCLFKKIVGGFLIEGVHFVYCDGVVIRFYFVMGGDSWGIARYVADLPPKFPWSGNDYSRDWSINDGEPNNAAKLMYGYNLAPLAKNLYEEESIGGGLTMRGIRNKTDKTNVLIINNDSELPQ